MCDSIGDAIKHIREFFLAYNGIVSAEKPQPEAEEAKTLVNNLFSHGDAQFYLSAVAYLQQVSDIKEAEKLIQQTNINADRSIIGNPAYRSLVEKHINLVNEFEEYKAKSSSAIPKLEALNTSLNTMLTDEQNLRSELETRLSKTVEQHRKNIDDLRSRVTSREQMVHELEERIDKLQAENGALAKSKGRNVEAVYTELQNVKLDLELKSEKIRMVEEQNRQNLMIYANEISQLKDENMKLTAQLSSKQVEPAAESPAAPAESAPQRPQQSIEDVYKEVFAQIDRDSINATAIDAIARGVHETLEKKKSVASDILASFGIKSYENIVSELDAMKKQLDDKIEKEKVQFEQQKSTIQQKNADISQTKINLETEISTHEKELQTLTDDVKDKETKITELSAKLEQLLKDISENQTKQEQNNQTLADVTNKVENNSNNLTQNKAALEDLLNKIQQKTEELATIKENNKNLLQEITNGNGKSEELESDIRQADDEQKRLQTRLDAINKRLGELEKNKQDNENSLKRLRETIDKQNESTTNTLSTVTNLETKVAQVNENLQLRIQMIRDAADEMEEVRNTHANLMKQMNELADSLQKQLDDRTPFDEQLH
ncbi:hypothetical protein TVAG_134300 [Trichomonas vaginalis G3]|uniref:Uncharacterized protein n=1 Tax=Trichomonas vaginalis (strain ATCC PRA-98 / G3) TaxID=412133 RepID=A2F381_TRIV3|nr:biological adhesion protein [Trichomonas vaginalis G3]EAY00640.1 hypothetical protein TVAG_134300 [Trichomonas vaginalis G3]KAI5500004.1 biological adhesion protein [Trichomonas vaginalis G3]|eukprot:XP_001313569.1 hypothetical protein [Trichomonas vaginalis G3]